MNDSQELGSPLLESEPSIEEEEDALLYTSIMTDSSTRLDQAAADASRTRQVSAMLSNFSTSYNVVNISIVLAILKESATVKPTEEEEAFTASSLLGGMMLGQLLGGALGDAWSPTKALMVVMALQIVASFATALIPAEEYWGLAAWRFVLGIGAGGVYPLAAVLSAAQENSNSHNTKPDDSLHRVVLTFSMQGVGFTAVPLLSVALLYIIPSSDYLGFVWRTLLAVGSVPGILLMVMQWRLHHKSGHEAVVPEEAVIPRNEDDSDGGNGSVLDSAADVIQPAELDMEFEHSSWWESIRHEPDLTRKLVGTAATWFLFDVLFYGNTLFQPIVLEAALGGRSGLSDLKLLRKTAVDSLALAAMALPGYATAGILLGKTVCGKAQTPRYVMLQGFCVMATLYLFIGIAWQDLRHSHPLLLVILYGATFFAANYGPNTTTFVMPSVVYSPDCRSTLNGVSAAAGKLGAAVGATLFEPLAESWGDATIMLLCAGVAAVAWLLTYIFVPSMGGQSVDEGDNNNDDDDDDDDDSNLIASGEETQDQIFA